MRYQVRHLTRYRYERPVSQSHNRAHVLPRDTAQQRCLGSAIQVFPAPAVAAERRDYFGNRLYLFSVESPHTELAIEVVSQIEITGDGRGEPALDFGLGCAPARERLWREAAEEHLLAREFLLDSPMIRVGDALHRYGAPSFDDGRPLLSAVRELTGRIFRDFVYDPDFTTVATPLDEVLENRRGVCQDFAHLAIGCLRSLGFPARYVSGYVETAPVPGQQRLVGADASHAWFSVYVPGEGWVDFDPTNDNMPGSQHITTAWGRDYSDVSPLRGIIFDGGDCREMTVAVDVERVWT
ncbi:MAG: transglutaminase family protein [Pseudomonadota bacterium]|jgi:transglutaminase-like putative cysteine protease